MHLQLDNVSKKYVDFYALKSINFTFENGVYGLLGANGAGKTTLINILIGAANATDGAILLDGVNIRQLGTDYLKLIGFMPQYPKFYPNYRVDEFLDYMCCIKNIKKTYRKNRIDEVLRDVNLVEQKKKKIKELSGGMRQRLGIAQALLNNPQILILDEPTAGLDPRGRDTILGEIREYHEERKNTVLLVSHSMEDIAQYAKKVLVIAEGRPAMYDTVESIFGRVEELTAMGLAVPQISRVFAGLRAAGCPVPENIYTVEGAAAAILTAVKGGAAR